MAAIATHNDFASSPSVPSQGADRLHSIAAPADRETWVQILPGLFFFIWTLMGSLTSLRRSSLFCKMRILVLFGSLLEIMGNIKFPAQGLGPQSMDFLKVCFFFFLLPFLLKGKPAPFGSSPFNSIFIHPGLLMDKTPYSSLWRMPVISQTRHGGKIYSWRKVSRLIIKICKCPVFNMRHNP